MKLDDKKENAAESFNGGSGVPVAVGISGVGVGVGAMSGNAALHAGRLPRALHEELALILKRIGSKDHNRDALSQLYDLRVNIFFLLP